MGDRLTAEDEQRIRANAERYLSMADRMDADGNLPDLDSRGTGHAIGIAASLVAGDVPLLLAEVDALRAERDQAVAHDRQPYPTAAAYEAACHALHYYRQIADEATAALTGVPGHGQEAHTLRTRFEAGAGSVGRPDTGSLASQLTAAEVTIARLESWLHERELHPDFEYATTTGPRKAWDDSDVPPGDGEGWDHNRARGNQGWERFEYHEESYWRRRKP